MNKPIKVDIPYPSLENIYKDERSAFIISSAYSGLHSELKAVLQYVYHAQYFNYGNERFLKETLLNIAITEMEHLNILGELLIKLGADPKYTLRAFDKYNYFCTDCISYSKTPEKMILDDISGEITAINAYNEINEKLKNEKVSAIITRIKLDEELHVKVLKKLLEDYLKNAIY